MVYWELDVLSPLFFLNNMHILTNSTINEVEPVRLIEHSVNYLVDKVELSSGIIVREVITNSHKNVRSPIGIMLLL